MSIINKIPSFEGKSIELVPVNRQNVKEIYNFQKDICNMYLWTNQREVYNGIDFEEYFLHRLKTYYHVFLLIVSTANNEVVGFVYSYDISPLDGTIYAAIYLKEAKRNKGFGAKAGALFLDYLFTYYPFRKIYCDVFGYNKTSYSFLENTGFVVEGELKEHRFFGGQYYSLFKFAMYRELFYSRYSMILSKIKNRREGRVSIDKD